MKPSRTLVLKKENLTELTADELHAVAAAGHGDDSYTGNPFCVLSIRQPCVTSFCTLLCLETT